MLSAICAGSAGGTPRNNRLVVCRSRGCKGEGRIGERRKTLDIAKRREIADGVITCRKSGADMARLYGVSQPTVSRIVEYIANRD